MIFNIEDAGWQRQFPPLAAFGVKNASSYRPAVAKARTMQTPALVLALDVPHRASLESVLQRLEGAPIEWFKIGLELFCAEGPAALLPLRARGGKIFLDLKLHDIPRTVARAAVAAARHGADMMTVHASGGRDMIRAAAEAVRACGERRPAIVAVTALTSLNDADARELGITRPLRDQVLALAAMALEAGADGVVCSPLEAAELRRAFGPNPLIVTPGIRAAGEPAGDQKRTLSAAEAARAGATHLVVGRPVLEAADPAAAARRLKEEIERAAVE